MNQDRIAQAKLILRAHEQRELVEKEKQQRSERACNNCIFCEHRPKTFFRSGKYHCAVKDRIIGDDDNDLLFLCLESKAETCPCYENKYETVE